MVKPLVLSKGLFFRLFAAIFAVGRLFAGIYTKYMASDVERGSSLASVTFKKVLTEIIKRG